MSERAQNCIIITAAAAATLTCLSLGGAFAGAAPHMKSMLIGVMSLWGAAGISVVIAMAALTLNELIGTLLTSAREALRTAIAFEPIAAKRRQAV
jgi:hypothetical protein